MRASGMDSSGESGKSFSQPERAPMGFYSQTGEDALLSHIFRDQSNGVCLEIGALDGVKDSTTLHFEKNGWRCVLVEANPELAEQARANRRGPVFSCAAGDHAGTVDFPIVEDAQPLSTMILSKVEDIRASGFNQHKTTTVPLRRLDTLLEQAGVSRLDFCHHRRGRSRTRSVTWA